MKRLGLAASIALVLLAAACGSSGSGGSSGSATSNGASTWCSGWATRPPPPASQGAEYESLKGLVADFTKLHPKIHIRMEYVDNDYALQKVTVALQGGQQPDISYQYGTNMPQIGQAARSGQPDQDRQAAEVRLERLRPRRAGRRHGQRQGARRPGPGGQPRGGLQQDPVRAAPPGAARAGLDLEPAGRRRQGHQQPVEEDLRPHLPRRRQRDHGLGVRGDALGGRRSPAHPGRQPGRLQLPGRGAGAADAAVDAAVPLALPGLPSRRRDQRDPVQLRQARHDHHRPVGPVQLPVRALRRADHAVVGPPAAATRRSPGRTTGSSSTTAPPGSTPRWSSCSSSSSPPTC